MIQIEENMKDQNRRFSCEIKIVITHKIKSRKYIIQIKEIYKSTEKNYIDEKPMA